LTEFPEENSNSPPRPSSKRKRFHVEFSFAFIHTCMPIIAGASATWALSATICGFLVHIPLDIDWFAGIIVIILFPWLALIFLAKKGHQKVALDLLFVVAILSGLTGSFYPLMVRIPIGCMILIVLWWPIGYLIHAIEHKPFLVFLAAFGEIVANLIVYYLVLKFFFHETFLDWALYIAGNFLITNGLIYDSFRVKASEIQENKMWAVFRAIRNMFIAFVILIVIVVIIALGYFGVDIGGSWTTWGGGGLGSDGWPSKSPKKAKIKPASNDPLE